MKKFFAVIVVIGSFLGLFTGCTLLEEPVVVEMSSWDMALDPGDMFGVAFMTMNVTVPGQLESLTFFDSTQGGSPEDFEEIRFYYQYELVASVQPTTTTFEVTFGENGLRLEPLVTELYVECTISQTATRGAKHQLSLQSLSGKADVESEMEGITIPYILANPGATTGWLTIGREIVPEGQLIINRSPVMPTSRQVYSGLEFEVMNYYLTAQNEDIRVTELPIFIDTAHYDSIERFWCYVDGQIVGNPDGQMPHPYGTYWLPCDFVVNDFLSSYLVHNCPKSYPLRI